jgi:CAAX prenyl protease-like protein
MIAPAMNRKSEIRLREAPWFPYVTPFAVFILLLGLHSILPLPDVADQILRVCVMLAVLWFIARPALDFRVRNLVGTLGIGVAVFIIWVVPDLLIHGYRESVLFQNVITGKTATSLAKESFSSWPVLILRTFRASIIVPPVEELFWRAWLMRWLIDNDFEKVPLGTYAPAAFWLVAILFASEHGPYWDVGLAAGILYNWWMVRTKSLGDLILAHAVTNFILSVYVIAAGKWEYWL